ncbi:MAG: restriction endonuclease [Sulfuriferula multivorans]|uniref:Restriction endonuclease n=1 Tax=Sulfuriferula multivorans TaxID=1559896 RepID=A0A7C9KA89_9PROT|nr:restriction endonuclease [Sulfuriferula multivorans]
MARRTHSRFENLLALISKLPWWAGAMLALAAYLMLHSMASPEVTAGSQPGILGGADSPILLNSLAMLGQYLVPAFFLLGAVVSVYGRYRSEINPGGVATRAEWGALNAMTWRQFETLVGESFRRKGYSVTKTGGGSDSDFHLVLKQQDKTFLVQCKQWRAIKVGVNTVRELNDVMTAQGANGGYVVTSGLFTDEAQAFASSHHIDLLDGKSLHALIHGVTVPGKAGLGPLNAVTSGAPFCPECQGRMSLRKAKSGKHAGKTYWCCMRYPECEGRRRV